ncbi:MAG: cyanophycin synthetase [Burkholderiales bacterium]|jgi:cyanophycin synthetase|nr:cyanophycin synthetase [Burkholderiales bacterium]
MQFLRITYLRGPNLWTYRPVLEAWVDIGALEEAPSNTIPGFYERLVGWLPSLIEHHCSAGERGGFLHRVREGTWMAHVLEHVAIELQNLAGMQAGFGKARQTSQRGIYKVAFRARNEEVGRAALFAARDLVMAAIENKPFDVAAAVDDLRRKINDHHLGPSTACIVQAAAERRIPVTRLNDGNLVQLGYGARQRRIWTAETEHTSAIGEGIADDKDLAKRLLRSCGIPVPEGDTIADADAAWAAAQGIGLPVAVKPLDGNHGRGVVLDLAREEDVRAAFAIADAEGSGVIVERFVRGDEHRLLVVGNRLVAAARGEAAWVTGNGRDTVEALIDAQLNSDPRRGRSEDFPLNKLLLDEDPVIALELTRQQLTRNSVPAVGQRVLIQRNGNLSADVTEKVHPENAELVALAARVIGLDIAGIDLVAEDIRRPFVGQEAAIISVNAGPGLLMHLQPASGKPQPVGEAIINHLFPDVEQCGRIPVFGITGSQGTTAIAQRLAALLRLGGYRVGLACRDGLYFGHRRVDTRNAVNRTAGERLLMNRLLDAAVIESDAALILHEGLAYDRCRIGIVTDAGGLAALADDDILTPEQLCQVLRTQVDVVLPDGVAVLNAHDPLLIEMAPLCDGEVIFYAADSKLPAIAQHCADGGRAVVTNDEGQVMLIHGNHTTVLNTRSAPHLETLATIAAVWAFGANAMLIRFGIERLETDPAVI